MEAEASTFFETCEIMAALLASSPLLPQSWSLCKSANAAAPESFTAEVIGDVAYVAFSGVQVLPLSSGGTTSRELVALEGEAKELFSPLNRHHPEAPMVDSALLHIFLNIFTHQNLLEKMSRVMQKSKSIVITGHSLGGATATLCTLWLLSFFQSKTTHQPLLCITFGSPLIGNESLSRAILRERWCGKFCHVVSNHDMMPRLLSTPLLPSLSPQLHVLLRYWHLSMASPQFGMLATQSSQSEKDELFQAVLAHWDVISNSEEGEGSGRSQFWPFGNFFFCSENGAICLDNGISVMKMLYLMLKTSAPNFSIEDHLNYGDYVEKVGVQHMERKSFTSECLPDSSYEAGLALALQSSGISFQDEVARMAKNSLRTARRMGQRPNLNAAKLAVSLSKITPYRAEIEWFKASCDEADNQLGYYDSFKRIDASVRHSRVNMNRHKLATFWNGVIDMWENNELPPDFNRRAKWVNASHFYKLLVEPLDIAEYYRRGKHIVHGHYLKHGRERRYEVFDKWWRGREVTEERNTQRMKYAGLTQDSCFWARLEEARDLLENIKCEEDVRKLALIWKSLENFERYARGLIERKEVSKDVVAKNSSYALWAQELRALKLQM